MVNLVAVHKSLGHPVRLRILAMLRSGELCVCQLIAVLRLAASTVSAHLTELRRAGIIGEHKSGRWVFYSLATEEPTAELLQPVWAGLEADQQIAADDELIRQIRRIDREELCRAGLDLHRLGIQTSAAPARAARASGKRRQAARANRLA